MNQMSDANTFDLDWIKVAKLVMMSRIIDIIEEEQLAPGKKIQYQFSAKGHELAQVLLGLSLNHQHDGATVYYRSRPFMLARGLTMQEAFAASLALTGSSSEGRDTGVLYSMNCRKGATVLPASGYVGAQFTPATGWAQAISYRESVLMEEEWQGAIALTFGGDGSVASNGFWAALNIATTLELPMLFVVENNQYGISTPATMQTPEGDIAQNLANFGNLLVLNGSGVMPAETADLVERGISHVRDRKGPCLLHLRVPRLTGHTYGEDQSIYKPEELMHEELLRDPVDLLKEFLGADLDWDRLWNEVYGEAQSALEAALQNSQPSPRDVTRHLFFDGAGNGKPPNKQNADAAVVFTSPDPDGPSINMVEAIRRVLDTELTANPRALIFGEDVGLRGGIHRATLGLYQKHGGLRVFDTSLSEEGIVGRALGMALAGLRPVPEIQFRKYADPAMEQISDIGWIRWRTAGKFSAPVVMRIPIGQGKTTGDPYHAYSGEAIYTHLLGWRIAYPSNSEDAVGLLRAAMREQDPTLFLEHRALLYNAVSRRPYPGDDFVLPFGKAAIVQRGDSLTIVTWGEFVHRCVAAAKSFEGQVEIIDLRTLIPWDKEAVLSSVAKTGKLIVAHEDNRTAGFAGEIASTVTEEAFTDLDGPLLRIASADTPTPYNYGLRNAAIPSVAYIKERIEWLLGW